MNKKSSKLMYMAIVAVMTMLLSASISLSAEKPAHWPKAITIAAGTGMTYYAIAGGIGKMMESYLNTAGIPTKTSGGTETARLMAKGDLTMGFITPDIGYEAGKGVGRFKDEGPAPIRVFLQDFPLTYNLMTLEGSGIRSWSDLKGKSGYYMARGSGMLETLWNEILPIYGLKEADLKHVMAYDRASEWVSALKTGKADFAVDMGFHPSAKWTELASTHPMKIIGVDEAHLAKLKEKLPYVFRVDLKANTYKTITEDVILPTIAVVVYVRADVPDDFVYAITKMIWTHFDEFKTYHPVCKFFNKEAVTRTNFLYHPGAIKYYKEVSVWGDELDKRQQRLLAEIGAKR